jgi:thiamine kinase-like enzyme
MEDIDELQKKSFKLLDKKRKAIKDLDYGTDCFYRTVWDFDKKIFRKRRRIYKKAKEILDDKAKFTGVAFVSFETED